MKHLRLTNNKEFYNEGQLLHFLGDIHDINIIIGANNTRKSRFLRAIINHEINVLVDASPMLNDAFNRSQNIFSELETLGSKVMNDRLFRFEFSTPSGASKQYLKIKEFFDVKSEIDFVDLKVLLGNVNETLVSMAVEDNFNVLTNFAQQGYNVSSLFLEIFSRLNTSGLPDPSVSTPTSIDGIGYFVRETGFDGIPHHEIIEKTIKRLNEYLKIIINLSAECFLKNIIYIPVLRTSRTIRGFSTDVYGDTLMNQYFKNGCPKLQIETGLMLYEKIGLARNGSQQQIRDFKAFEKFIGKVFFQSDDLHIVAHQTGNKEDRNIRVSLPGELEDISIHNLGDGVQAVINLLFPVFTAPEGSWIFIDEPETHLHPGYQNLLIQALSNNKFIHNKKLRFFINTHSNHILSGALLGKNSAEIFVFSRRDLHSTNIQSFNGNEYFTLEKLGVLNTSVLISNCTIWVEGVTDRFYLQSFLHAFLNSIDETEFKPVEGLHFSFLEYGGKNLAHYEFDHDYHVTTENDSGIRKKIEAFFLNSNVFLLADSDFDEKKHKYFESLETRNFRYLKTDLPEIENILPEAILRGFLKDKLKVPEHDLASLSIDYSVKLGEAFEGKIKRGNANRKIMAEKGAGTLNSYYKKMLADYVHEKLLNESYTWKDLKESIKLTEIITALYDFILEKNRVSKP